MLAASGAGRGGPDCRFAPGVGATRPGMGTPGDALGSRGLSFRVSPRAEIPPGGPSEPGCRFPLGPGNCATES